MSNELKTISPQSIDELVTGVTPEIVNTLKTAIEIGKWQDGSKLTSEQLENCIQVLILYENKYIAEPERVGFNLSDTATTSCRKNKFDMAIEEVKISGEAAQCKH